MKLGNNFKMAVMGKGNIIMQMVDGFPIVEASKKVCSSCVIGKQHRDSFPKKSLWRATKLLQLVHSDICGPITLESNSHKRYVLTCSDDYSRKT